MSIIRNIDNVNYYFVLIGNINESTELQLNIAYDRTPITIESRHIFMVKYPYLEINCSLLFDYLVSLFI